MPVSRQHKEQILGEYQEKIRQAQVMIWSGYKGLTFAQTTELRDQLRGVGADLVVVKNSVMHKALTAAKLPFDTEMMNGTSIVTFVYDNIPGATRFVTEYARTHDTLKVKGGLLGTSLVSAAQVVTLVDMPTREVLLSRVVGSMQAPITNFVSVLAGVMRGLVNVLDARAKQLEGSPS